MPMHAHRDGKLVKFGRVLVVALTPQQHAPPLPNRETRPDIHRTEVRTPEEQAKKGVSGLYDSARFAKCLYRCVPKERVTGHSAILAIVRARSVRVLYTAVFHRRRWPRRFLRRGVDDCSYKRSGRRKRCGDVPMRERGED